MPYKTNADLPAQVRDALPDAAQSRFRTVVNSALERGLSDAKAFGSGWTAVRNGWVKPSDGGKWVRKAAGKATLFASRPVENAQDIIDWAKSQGFETTLGADDMHVTQAYSKEPLNWPEAHDDALIVRSKDGRKVGPLGDQGAMVLHFNSPTMTARHDQLKSLGAKSDYPGYTPHVTISWKAGDLDPSKVEPYAGPIMLGPERFREVNPDWSPDSKTEKYNEAHDERGRFASGDGGGGGGGAVPDKAPDGPLLFHGSSEAVLENILSEGLKPATGGGAQAEHDRRNANVVEGPGGQPAAVYFASSPRLAARYAEWAAKETGSTPVVIPVHLDRAQADKLVWDKRSTDDMMMTAAIPPDRLGAPRVGKEAIKSLLDTYNTEYQNHQLSSEQRSGVKPEKPRLLDENPDAVRNIMGGRGIITGKAAGDRRLVYAVLFIKPEESAMDKAGARHNASDRAMVQEVHDHAVKLGADCPGMAKLDLDGERFQKFKALTTINQDGESVARASVIKVDDELGLVFGWAMVCKEAGRDYYDVQDDHIPEDAMLKASTDFMLSRRVAKEMHFGDEKGTIVFAFPVTADVAKAMGITTERTGLMIAMKPESAALLEKFRSGEYTGFSIGGQRLIDETIEDMAA